MIFSVCPILFAGQEKAKLFLSGLGWSTGAMATSQVDGLDLDLTHSLTHSSSHGAYVGAAG